MTTLTVVSPGPLSTVQDLGRPGFGYLGVGRSGAADRRSHTLANRLVGNSPTAATVETTMGRLRVRFDDDMTVAVTGAHCELRISDRTLPMNAVLHVLAGQELRLGAPSTGLRSYLAVRGGIDVAPVLGSRSTDILSGIGPEKLSAGTVLAVGTPTDEHSRMFSSDIPGPQSVLRVTPGPRDDWFVPGAVEALYDAEWLVSTQANRIGVRLAGPALERRITRELPPEPMVVGALQVPPDGRPIIFLADHPVTGGYPVIGVIADDDLSSAAHLRPGQTVRFGPR